MTDPERPRRGPADFGLPPEMFDLPETDNRLTKLAEKIDALLASDAKERPNGR